MLSSGKNKSAHAMCIAGEGRGGNGKEQRRGEGREGGEEKKGVPACDVDGAGVHVY